MLLSEAPAEDQSCAIQCTVCIANYNGAAYIDWCLSSVIEQETDFEFEVVVHDDNSSDESVSTIRESYPQVRLLCSASTVGFCVSNNRMVEAANGRFVLLLNNDAALRPGALQALCGASRTSPNDILSLPQYEAGTGSLLDRGIRPDLFLNSVPNLDSQQSEVGSVHGACLWILRDQWHEVGGFPDWFESMVEDLYLCCRVRLRGGHVRVLTTSGFDHRVGTSFGGGKVSSGRLRTTKRRRALSERNRLFTMCVVYPFPWVGLFLPLHLLLLALEGLVVSLILRDRGLWRTVYWAAFRAAWQARGKVKALRVATQAERTVRGLEFFAPFRLVHRKLSALFAHGLPDVR